MKQLRRITWAMIAAAATVVGTIALTPPEYIIPVSLIAIAAIAAIGLFLAVRLPIRYK